MVVFIVKDARRAAERPIVSVNASVEGALKQAKNLIPEGGIPRFLRMNSGYKRLEDLWKPCTEAEAHDALANHIFVRLCYVPPTLPGVEMFATDLAVIQAREVLP
jgi:hypothetical protein